MGYHRAGFRVIGVDIAPQPKYPFEFIQADALEFDLSGFDYIHASPPCQAYSKMSKCRPDRSYPDLVPQVRERLVESGATWVIENVPAAPLVDPIMLCGHMFGLQLYRHRLFESNADIPQPVHRPHTLPAAKAGRWQEGTIMSVVGHCAPMWKAREAMGIDWMRRHELVEAIPPAYSHYIGNVLLYPERYV